jgi:predicted Zn-ribbon and HTH transcriptional regulator
MLRERLERYNTMAECVVCGATDNIHVHHIDGDQSNNSAENRVKLCSRHHRRVHGNSQLSHLKDEKVLELKKKLPETEPLEVQCKRCSYSWESETVNEYVTCPSCQSKTPVQTND